MPLVEEVQLLHQATSVASGVALAASCGTLFYLLAIKHREKSIREKLAGEGVVRPGDVVRILKHFKRDEHRLEALKAILGFSGADSERILGLVHDLPDSAKLATSESRFRFASLVAVGLLLLGFTGLGLIAETTATAPKSHPKRSLDASLGTSPSQTTPTRGSSSKAASNDPPTHSSPTHLDRKRDTRPRDIETDPGRNLGTSHKSVSPVAKVQEHEIDANTLQEWSKLVAELRSWLDGEYGEKEDADPYKVRLLKPTEDIVEDSISIDFSNLPRKSGYFLGTNPIMQDKLLKGNLSKVTFSYIPSFTSRESIKLTYNGYGIAVGKPDMSLGTDVNRIERIITRLTELCRR